MASTNVNSSWEKIQRGVKDTERLIGQKEYNAAMVQSRQTLEFMVKLLANRIGLNENQDLMQLIDGLYQHRAISKSTCEHYHKIRMIGNKAAHEGDTSAYNANQTYHILAQEVYSFANDYRNAQRGSRRSSSGQSQSASRSRKRQAAKSSSFQLYTILKLLIPVLCVVLLFLIIRLVKPAKDNETQPVTTPTNTETMVPPETNTPEETAPPAVTYKTTSNLNVRTQPDTSGEALGQISSGSQVEYVRAHNDEWAVIMYEGQEAYVASRYLTTE
ncbi:MAG: SH3 domain-containing protein [Lachnospiraceae bacterium]